MGKRRRRDGEEMEKRWRSGGEEVEEKVEKTIKVKAKEKVGETFNKLEGRGGGLAGQAWITASSQRCGGSWSQRSKNHLEPQVVFDKNGKCKKTMGKDCGRKRCGKRLKKSRSTSM